MLVRLHLGHKTLLASTICAILTGCGGSGSSSTPANTAPTIDTINPLNLTVDAKKEIQIKASDKENNILSYSIKTAPTLGQATIDSKTGLLNYQAYRVVGEDKIVVSVSDGQLSSDITIQIQIHSDSVFDYQFYRITNPDTANAQIVRYDPNNNDPKTNQKVVKHNVILGDRVFIMSAAKNGDQTVYNKREYAIFLDPNASSEKRLQTVDGKTTEYTFYTDNILKRFDADNPDNEQMIFSSKQLSEQLKTEGMTAIGDSINLYVNETDINNSYIELRAFAKLPDTLKGEMSDQIKNTHITVRLSDGKMTQGRTIKPIIDQRTGQTTAVLVNYSAAHTANDESKANARLQSCNIDLSQCHELGENAKGQFYFLAQNDSHIYLAKANSTTLYAFDKNKQSLNSVTGASYPAAYRPAHHGLKFSGGHGGAGVFSNFYNMAGVIDNLSEGNTSYLLINYNLDTNNAAATSPIYGKAYVAKNAQILKLEGTQAQLVYDNGTGKDLANASANIALSYNLNLTAVKNGQLFVEAAKIDKERMIMDYQQGWIDATTTTLKTHLDNPVISQEISYFTSLRVPAVAVGEYIYVNETNPIPSATRVYNIYKLPLNNPKAKPTDKGIEHVTGRMYFERSAFRSSGIYEGNVLLWDKNNHGVIRNATTGKIMGQTKPDYDGKDKDGNTINISNVTADASGNSTLAGIGGLFGLHMTYGHGQTPLLGSGFANKEQSLKKVNQIDGAWITD